MKIKKLGALLVSAALCAGMAAPAFAFEGEAAPVEQPVLTSTTDKEDAVTVTDEETGLTSRQGVFAGGDAVTGAATVILAMGAGKTAAAAMDAYMQSK